MTLGLTFLLLSLLDMTPFLCPNLETKDRLGLMVTIVQLVGGGKVILGLLGDQLVVALVNYNQVRPKSNE